MIVDPTISQTSDSMATDNTNTSTSTNTNEHRDDEHAHAPPPSYEAVVGNGGHFSAGQYVPESATKAQDVKVPALPMPSMYNVAGPSQAPAGPGGQAPATVVYNYVNPTTGERVVSLLPPDHPQMLCLQQGGHAPSTKFGILGILAAILWFPLGVGLCLLDRKVYCRRCGAVLDEGIC